MVSGDTPWPEALDALELQQHGDLGERVAARRDRVTRGTP